MKKNSLLVLLLLITCFIPRYSFASSREELMDQTLVNTETSSVLDDFEQNKDSAEDSASNPQDPQKKSGTREEAIQNAFYIAAAFDTNHIHYSEWSEGVKQDEDFGHHNGFYVAMGYKSQNYYRWLMGVPFIEAYYRNFKNQIHYKGRITGGAEFDTDERSDVQQFGVKVGATQEIFDEKGSLLGFVDVGKRIWDRGVNEMFGNVRMYAEKYTWIYIGIGAGVSYKVIPKLSIGIEGEWMFTIPDSRKMYADDIGYGDLTFKLGNVWGAEVKLPIKYQIFKHLSLDVTPYFTYWQIKHSNYLPIGGGYYLVEPDSRTHLEGVLAGFTYTF